MADLGGGTVADVGAGGDWFEQEGSLAARGRLVVPRVLRRALGSWPRWVGAALLFSFVLGYWRSHRKFGYEVTVVLRVAEGAGAHGNGLISLGDLRDQIDELAFPRDHLLALMTKYRINPTKGDIDSAESITAFRELFEVTLAENDVIEDDQSPKERRSARVSITFHSTNNERAYNVAHELVALVVGSGLARQKKVLEVEAAATHEFALHAAAEVTKIRHEPGGGDWGRLKPAVDRLTAAQKEEAAAALALRSLGSHQALDFEIVDPGRVPREINPREIMLTVFASCLLISLLAGSLVAGAFDPRVLDGEDLAALGVGVLGRFPALPAIRRPRRDAPAPGGSERPAPRV